jgi:hypothetical protein
VSESSNMREASDTILGRPNRARAGVFSLAQASPDGPQADADYLAWHLLDHLPEQYRNPALVHGLRWVSTPACRARRAGRMSDSPVAARFDPVHHVTHYLFAEPLDEALDDFLALGTELAGLDRYPIRLPGVLLATYDVAAVAAAARVRVSPPSIPFRPTRGVYLVVEPAAPTTGSELSDLLAELVAVDGVAGVWRFDPSERRSDRFDAAGLAVTVCYLDEPPAAVAPALEVVLDAAWARWGTAPALAGPFETVRPPWA